MGSCDLDAGGPDIQRQCRRYVQQSGHLTGTVYVSTAGRLPCKHVIHAVVPVLEGADSPERLEEDFLRLAVVKSLSAARKRGLSSIAFPAPGSESFGLPIDTCTKIMTLAVKDYINACVKKVSLVDPSDDVVDAFRNSLIVEFGSEMVTTRFDGYDTSKGEG